MQYDCQNTDDSLEGLCQDRQGLMPARSPRRRLYEPEASPELATRLPRKARAGRWQVGAWCPLSIRGTEKRRIVNNCKDRYNTVSRLGQIASEIPRRAMN